MTLRTPFGSCLPEIMHRLARNRSMRIPWSSRKASRSLSPYSLPHSRTKTPQNIRFLALCSGSRCRQSCRVRVNFSLAQNMRRGSYRRVKFRPMFRAKREKKRRRKLYELQKLRPMICNKILSLNFTRLGQRLWRRRASLSRRNFDLKFEQPILVKFETGPPSHLPVVSVRIGKIRVVSAPKRILGLLDDSSARLFY